MEYEGVFEFISEHRPFEMNFDMKMHYDVLFMVVSLRGIMDLPSHPRYLGTIIMELVNMLLFGAIPYYDVYLNPRFLELCHQFIAAYSQAAIAAKNSLCDQLYCLAEKVTETVSLIDAAENFEFEGLQNDELPSLCEDVIGYVDLVEDENSTGLFDSLKAAFLKVRDVLDETRSLRENITLFFDNPQCKKDFDSFCNWYHEAPAEMRTGAHRFLYRCMNDSHHEYIRRKAPTAVPAFESLDQYRTLMYQQMENMQIYKKTMTEDQYKHQNDIFQEMIKIASKKRSEMSGTKFQEFKEKNDKEKFEQQERMNSKPDMFETAAERVEFVMKHLEGVVPTAEPDRQERHRQLMADVMNAFADQKENLREMALRMCRQAIADRLVFIKEQVESGETNESFETARDKFFEYMDRREGLKKMFRTE